MVPPSNAVVWTGGCAMEGAVPDRQQLAIREQQQLARTQSRRRFDRNDVPPLSQHLIRAVPTVGHLGGSPTILINQLMLAPAPAPREHKKPEQRDGASD